MSLAIDVEAWSDLEELSTRWASELGVPSAAVGLVLPNEFEQINAGVAEDAIFPAASLTKPLVALAVARLARRGALDLDAPLTGYGIAPPYSDPRTHHVTARMALTHTSGLPNGPAPRDTPLLFTPGTRWSYSCEGYVFLQRALECVTPVEREIEQGVFPDLGITRSFTAFPREANAAVVRGHDAQGSEFPFRSEGGFHAASSLYTDVSSYALFLRHMLVPEQAHLLQPQIRLDDELAWGLAFGLETWVGQQLSWQWGDDSGFKHFALLAPQQPAALIVLTNSDNGVELYRRVVTRMSASPHPAFRLTG